ncbi:hypothetical protein D3C83_64990 [compost metagenome]
MRCAGIRRRIHEARGALAKLVDHAPRYLLLGLEAEILLVEFSSAADVFHWDVGIHGTFLQHGFSPGI